ncbi:MAG: tetratricopeptide (TPR) repeat protein [Cryomorphaceae bacterium]
MKHLQGLFVISNKQTIRTCLIGTLFLLVIPLGIFAQDDLNIHGVVSDAMTSSKLVDVKVTVKKDGSVHDNFTTRANGKYEFYLDCGAQYEFVFERSGYVKRSIKINSNGVPVEIIGAGIIMPTDMSMYEITEAMEGADLSVFDKPIGKASYDPAQADLVWDFAYTNQIKSEIFKFIRDVEKKQKELEKEASAEDKAAMALEEKFNDFVKKGDDAMSGNDYEDAVLNYRAALDLKPGDGAVEAKLGDAQTKWNNQKAQQKLDADYSAALDGGDGYMRTEEYDKAVEKYQEALELRPEESYPKDQIAEAERIIEELAASMANQEQFNKIMAEADGFSDEEKFVEAIAKYEEALVVIPGNSEAKSKLAKAQDALANIEENAATKAQYEKLIAAADAAFAAENYEVAKTSYEEAADVLPDEAYPKTQIEACNGKLNALADAAEKKEAFDKLVADGDAAMMGTNYEDAVAKYQEALNLIPNEEPAVSKLAEAKGLLGELLADQQKQENYDALIKEADDAFSEETYDLAKSKYQEAKQVIPEKTYPLDQIAKIDAALAELAGEKAVQEAYNSAMASGAISIGSDDYLAAIGHFQDALTAIPADNDATKELESANAALSDQQAGKAQKEQYDALIASADSKFDAASWTEAIVDYEAALGILSDEAHPLARIEAAKTNIEKEKSEAEAAELQGAFDGLVVEGDNALGSEDFDASISKYEEALELMASAEVEAKLASAEEAKKAFLAMQGLQEQYDDAIAAADESFQGQDWEMSIELYQAASEIKPEENYPVDQIGLANEEINAAAAAAQAELQADFDALVTLGDKLLDENSFDPAIEKYEEALAILESAEVEAKIANTQKLQEEYKKQQGIGEQYDEAIANADALFAEKAWLEAKSSYEAASEIKQDEQYPKDRIALIDETIAAEESARQAELQATFDALVALGDKLLEEKSFDPSIEKYEEALAIMESAEVEAKIANAQKLQEEYKKQQGIGEQYADAIANADALFAEKAWLESKSSYEAASEIKQDEQYPKDRIALIDETIAAEEAARQAELQANFDALVALGDKLLDENSFDPSIEKYEEALAIMESAEVEAKIANAQKLQEEYKKQQGIGEQYADAIANADALFAEKAWLESKSSYEAASEIKQDEQYPKDRIALIDETLASEEAARQSEFDAFVASGDKFIENKSFDDGIVQYEQALDVMESAEVEDKIASAQSDQNQFDDEQAKQQRYDETIAEADVDFGQNNWDAALSLYETAGEILPEETYPKDQIALIEQKIAEVDEASMAALQAERESRVNALVAAGDESFGQKDFIAAMGKFEAALGILPEREDVSEKLSEAEAALLAQQESEALEQAYMSAIEKGNTSFDSQDWISALSSYEEALEIKPNESYPQEKIEEVTLKLDVLAEAERLEREAELKKDFDKLIAAGDKQFNKTKFDKALEEYELALNLLPDNALAQQKIKAAEEALGELEADRAVMNNYNAAIDEGDALFKSENYEMAKLKYADASDIMPNEEYPKNKMVEIDLILDRQRLKELAGERDALDRAYQTAIDEGDGNFASSSYDEARVAYNEAIKLKPNETYPKGQLERIDLKIEDAANAERKRKRLADLEEERRLAEEKRRENMNRVNTDSEDQAERFMREAREAEENQRYERIKKMKIQEEVNLDQYEGQSAEIRAANYLVFEAYRRKFADQYREPKQVQASKVGNSIKYKKALLGSLGRSNEMDEVRNGDQYNEILALEQEITKWKADMSAAENKSIRQEHEKATEVLVDVESKSAMNYNERVTANKEYQERNEELYRESEQLAQQRRDKAAELQKQNKDYGDYMTDLSEKGVINARQNKQDLNDRYAGRGSNSSFSSDVYRSELAENYPQGVTEESSTLGNKVIITRIVVSGKRGDEYKKVVDKAGEYYFKNGISISENTWNRETIDAFNKSKD